MKSNTKKFALAFLIILLVAALLFAVFAIKRNAPAEDVRIGVAWKTDDDSAIYKAIEDAGAIPVPLDLVQSADVMYSQQQILPEYLDENGLLTAEYAEKIKNNAYRGSNVEAVVGDIDAIVFPGGEDIMPTLYEHPEEWHGIASEKDYSATRDISDYLLMSYCIDQDIAVLSICRGMQMLSVVSGATVIQDIPTYFEAKGKTYNNEHRGIDEEDGSRAFAAHDVSVEKGSLLYKITGVQTLQGVPSWHHQAVESVAGTDLKVSGTAVVSGEETIEAVELPNKTFILGIQFHPEIAMAKSRENADDQDDFMAYEDAVKFFTALKEAA